jgi:hypothetical protein
MGQQDLYDAMARSLVEYALYGPSEGCEVTMKRKNEGVTHGALDGLSAKVR